MQPAFHIVDVFCESKYSGNQLAVVIPEEEIDDSLMQEIAKEFNFSETTFITSSDKAGSIFGVRIFTPFGEIPFAGHPTLGTAFVIANELLKEKVNKIIIHLKAGQIPVTIDYSGNDIIKLEMKQNIPEFLSILDAIETAGMLNLNPDELYGEYPVQAVSTGIPFIIIPIKKLKAIRGIRIDIDAYNRLLENTGAVGILAFAPETENRENNITSRVFAGPDAKLEDPATGSANGCLAGYLVKYNFPGINKVELKIEQGHEIGRPSLIHARAYKKNGDIDIFVGGQVVHIASGRLT